MSKNVKYVVAGVSIPQDRLARDGSVYKFPDVFFVTITSDLQDAKDFIDSGKVPDASSLEYIVIEEVTEKSVSSKIQRWYISKDKEITQLAEAPVEYKRYNSMIAM